MFWTFLIGLVIGGWLVYYVHPSSSSLFAVWAKIEEIETEMSVEIAKAHSLKKAGITAAQAEAKYAIMRIKSAF